MFCTYHNITFDWWLMSWRGMVFCWIKLLILVQETSWKWAFIKRTPTVSILNQFVSLVHKAFVKETTLSTSALLPQRAKANHTIGSKYLKDIFSFFKKSNQSHHFFLNPRCNLLLHFHSSVVIWIISLIQPISSEHSPSPIVFVTPLSMSATTSGCFEHISKDSNGFIFQCTYEKCLKINSVCIYSDSVTDHLLPNPKSVIIFLELERFLCSVSWFSLLINLSFSVTSLADTYLISVFLMVAKNVWRWLCKNRR